MGVRLGRARTRLLAIAALAAFLGLGGACSFPGAPGMIPPAVGAGGDIVVLHGLGRSSSAMRRLDGKLQEAGYFVVRPQYDSVWSTPEENLADLRRQIALCCEGRSAKLHFVGHSLGGLMIRAYLEDARPENLGHVVLLGTPNRGTAIVDGLSGSWWFSFAGPTAAALGTGPDSFPNSLPAPDYPVGVIAGRRMDRDNEDILPGEDDGLVAVASTRIDGMADFLVVDVGHARLRSNDEVARQVVTFLQTGRFSREVTVSAR